MYAALPPHAERLFLGFEHVISKSQGSNLTVVPKLPLLQWLFQEKKKEIKKRIKEPLLKQMQKRTWNN